ncbi:hypothetical protein CEXT_51351 [Caerostris extrusa]|uniref:Uncharacterized protein n=1 Tax=Caerostris extrusa TaxID=172846 RepID=A0AAV4MLX1_CAEEX|nr:hypothetical protein CEXT_51351 [Caerostris extrusa]
MNKPSQSRHQSATHETSTSGTIHHSTSSYWLISRTLGMPCPFNLCDSSTSSLAESQKQKSATHEASTAWNNTSRRQLLLAHFENPWNDRVVLILCDSSTSGLVGVTKVKRKAIQSFNPEMEPEAFISSPVSKEMSRGIRWSVF